MNRYSGNRAAYRKPFYRNSFRSSYRYNKPWTYRASRYKPGSYRRQFSRPQANRPSYYRRYQPRIPPQLVTAKESRVYVTQRGYQKAYKYDKTYNVIEIEDWTSTNLPASGTATYQFKWDYVMGNKKYAEWNAEWRKIEIRAIYLHAEIHNVRISSGVVNTVATDAPNMPMFMLFWDRGGQISSSSGIPVTDLTFAEQVGTQFIMRGKPITTSWHVPASMKGKAFDLSGIDMNSTVRALYETRFGLDGLHQGPGNLYLRLQDSYMYDWNQGTILSVAFRVVSYVKLSGSRKFQEVPSLNKIVIVLLF